MTAAQVSTYGPRNISYRVVASNELSGASLVGLLWPPAVSSSPHLHPPFVDSKISAAYSSSRLIHPWNLELSLSSRLVSFDLYIFWCIIILHNCTIVYTCLFGPYSRILYHPCVQGLCPRAIHSSTPKATIPARLIRTNRDCRNPYCLSHFILPLRVRRLSQSRIQASSASPLVVAWATLGKPAWRNTNMRPDCCQQLIKNNGLAAELIPWTGHNYFYL